MHDETTDMKATEVELKLLLSCVDADTAEKCLHQVDALTRSKTQTHWLWNRYFDTPDHDLRRQRSALRLRCVSDSAWPDAGELPQGKWIQTFKTAGISVGGLSQRGEWETAVNNGRLNQKALTKTPWVAMDPDFRCFKQLNPVFDTHCRRTSWQVKQDDGSELEVALDIGQIVSGDNVLPILELELELKLGVAPSLFALARQIAQHIAVLPCDVSKAERGYALGQGHVNAPRRTQSLRLKSNSTPLEAAQAVMGEIQDHLTRNLAGLCHADHPELIHQGRIAWRRWRSATWFFSPWLPHHPPRDGLRPLLTVLGHMRDLDVLVHETLPLCLPFYTAEDGVRAQLAYQTLADLTQIAARQRQQIRLMLASPGTGCALLDLSIWLHELNSAPVLTSESMAMAENVKAHKSHWASRRTGKMYRRLQRAIKVSQTGTPTDAELHQARLLAKRTRYNVESLIDLLPEKKSQSMLHKALRIQTRFGAERDIGRAADILHEYGLAPGLAEFLRGIAAARKI